MISSPVRPSPSTTSSVSIRAPVLAIRLLIAKHTTARWENRRLDSLPATVFECFELCAVSAAVARVAEVHPRLLTVAGIDGQPRAEQGQLYGTLWDAVAH